MAPVARVWLELEVLEDRVLPALFPPALSDLDGGNGFTVNGVYGLAATGCAVSGAGDINGDGHKDVLVCAVRSSERPGPARSYVVFGTANGFPAELSVSALNGRNGFAIATVRTGVGAGDVNGDGIDDLIVDDPAADVNGVRVGRAYVIFGRSQFAAVVDPRDLDGSDGFCLDSVDDLNCLESLNRIGAAVAGAGDVNGDGYDDVLIGAPGAEGERGFNQGRVYVVFGQSHFAAHVDLNGLNGANGFLVSGVNAWDQVGDSLSGAGDVNGDGLADLILGAPRAGSGDWFASKSRQGQAYVVFGQTQFAAALALSDLNGRNGFAINGTSDNHQLGSAVAEAGDVNGDGFADLIVGDPMADERTHINSLNGPRGAAYVIFGARSFTATVELSALDGRNGFRLQGDVNVGFAGISVAGAGDVNGDGLDDVIIGAPTGYPFIACIDVAAGYSQPVPPPGAIYVVLGQKRFGSTVELSVLDDGGGCTLLGAEGNDGTGLTVADTGDVNGDGLDDFVVGASMDGPWRGKAYVVFGTREISRGSDTVPPHAIHSAAPDVTAAGTAPYTFSVTYSDNRALDVGTLGTGDVVATGPNGFRQVAVFRGASRAGNSSVWTATYQISPPGGSWDYADNGTYTIAVEAGEVFDRAGLSVAGGTLATYLVAVGDPNPGIAPAGATLNSGPAVTPTVEATLLLPATFPVAAGDPKPGIAPAGATLNPGPAVTPTVEATSLLPITYPDDQAIAPGTAHGDDTGTAHSDGSRRTGLYLPPAAVDSGNPTDQSIARGIANQVGFASGFLVIFRVTVGTPSSYTGEESSATRLARAFQPDAMLRVSLLTAHGGRSDSQGQVPGPFTHRQLDDFFAFSMDLDSSIVPLSVTGLVQGLE